MFLVIGFHFSDHGMAVINCGKELTVNWSILAISRIFGALCNCGFMLVSGYFLYQKKFKLKNVFKLWLQVWFYSVVLGTICFFIGTEPFGLKSLLKMCMPFTFNEYWFFTTYIVIYLIFPFLNILIDVLDRRKHLALIIIGIVIFSVFGSIPKVIWVNGANDIPIFIVLYFVGAFINKYGIKLSKSKLLSVSLMFIILEIMSVFFARIVYQYTGMDNVSYFVWGTNKILPVLTSVALFLLFKNIKPKHTKWIAYLSPSLFGVYLFHIGRLNVFLFKDLFNDSMTYDSGMLLPQLLLAMISIFVCGIVFDKIRILLFEKPIFAVLKRPIVELDAKLANYLGL